MYSYCDLCTTYLSCLIMALCNSRGLNNAPHTKKLDIIADRMMKVPKNPYELNMSSIKGGNKKHPRPTPDVARPTASPRFLLK